MEKNRRSMRAQPKSGPRPLQVPSLIRRRNRGSGQTSFGFLALLLWRARLLPKCESTVKSVAWQGIAEV
ncbi:hypothetical protein V9K97_21230 [Variovorax sp. CCNWLW186]|uniref:hypothetical protein n=1 Tax=Variovorax sp. CCNWLW186 TaxID=3127473 RepID=UPI0030783386